MQDRRRRCRRDGRMEEIQNGREKEGEGKDGGMDDGVYVCVCLMYVCVCMYVDGCVGRTGNGSYFKELWDA